MTEQTSKTEVATETVGGNVYQLIARVAADLAQTGIAKGGRNDHAKYNFRGIDDLQKGVAPVLAEHGLIILPQCNARLESEKTTRNGGTMIQVVLTMTYEFISSHDGTKHDLQVYGEAMDSGDKATNKAMTAAYKYMLNQAFCIPTEGVSKDDADAQTHELAAEPTLAEQLKGVSDTWKLNELHKRFTAQLGKGNDDQAKQNLRLIAQRAKELGFIADKEARLYRLPDEASLEVDFV